MPSARPGREVPPDYQVPLKEKIDQ